METTVRLTVLVASLLAGWRVYEWIWLFVPGAQVSNGLSAIVVTAVITQATAGFVLQAIYPEPGEVGR